MNVGSPALAYNKVSGTADAPRQGKRPKKLPVEVWDAWRRELNQKRRMRANERKKIKSEELRRQQESTLGHLSAEELQQLEDERRQRDVARHLEQEARVAQALARGLKVVVDCSFNETASDKESRSLSKQLEVCCAINRRAPAPLALTFTSFTGPFLEQCARMGGLGWKANKYTAPTLELFEPSKVVVLSPDAPDPLLSLDPGRVYVVGGIIDRSVQKNVTLKYATSSGLIARRLPFMEFSEQLGLGKGTAKSPVLNVNDVVCALLDFNANGDWVQALDKALPSRKRKHPHQPSKKGVRPRSLELSQQAEAAAKRCCKDTSGSCAEDGPTGSVTGGGCGTAAEPCRARENDTDSIRVSFGGCVKAGPSCDAEGKGSCGEAAGSPGEDELSVWAARDGYGAAGGSCVEGGRKGAAARGGGMETGGNSFAAVVVGSVDGTCVASGALVKEAGDGCWEAGHAGPLSNCSSMVGEGAASTRGVHGSRIEAGVRHVQAGASCVETGDGCAKAEVQVAVPSLAGVP